MTAQQLDQRGQLDPLGADWLPTVWTGPLSAEPVSDGPRLIALVERYWTQADGRRLQLDPWQRWLITALLERYPLDWPEAELRGRLRYRQAVVSMGRQNGKSLLGAIFALYGLLQHQHGPSVVGLATSVEQANVIYERVAYAVRHNPTLNRVLKPTGTRGIRRRDGTGGYAVKPALEEGLQSVPVTLGLADELHLARPAIWDSIVNGQRAQRDGLILGITTAGDDSSELLKRLYGQGRKAAEGDPDSERFGFFLWEAPAGASIDDDDAIRAANPAIACGRVPLATVRSDIRNLPEVDQQRYTLNRFVASVSSWVPLSAWPALATGGIADTDQAAAVLSIARSDAWEFASVAAAVKVNDRLHTELVASLVRPTLDQLAQLCDQLRAAYPRATFAMSAAQLGALAQQLKDAGVECWALSEAEQGAAAATAYAAIVSGRVSHASDPLVNRQLPLARRRNTGATWRLVPADGRCELDALRATINALHVADVKPAPAAQFF